MRITAIGLKSGKYISCGKTMQDYQNSVSLPVVSLYVSVGFREWTLPMNLLSNPFAELHGWEKTGFVHVLVETMKGNFCHSLLQGWASGCIHVPEAFPSSARFFIWHLAISTMQTKHYRGQVAYIYVPVCVPCTSHLPESHLFEYGSSSFWMRLAHFWAKYRSYVVIPMASNGHMWIPAGRYTNS